MCQARRYAGGAAAALCVSLLWCVTHPQVKKMRASDLPPLPERDAIISFPVHRDVAFSTRATFTAVLLLLACFESAAYLLVWSTSPAPHWPAGAWVRVLALCVSGWVLATDLDSLLVRRFLVADALLEVSRRMRRPFTLRLSQVGGLAVLAGVRWCPDAHLTPCAVACCIHRSYLFVAWTPPV